MCCLKSVILYLKKMWQYTIYNDIFMEDREFSVGILDNLGRPNTLIQIKKKTQTQAIKNYKRSLFYLNTGNETSNFELS